MNLNDLNNDVLAIIFENCFLDDIISLYDVCKRFRQIIERHTLWKKCRNLLIIGYGNAEAQIVKKTLNDFSDYRRARIFQNWCHGRYEEHILFYTRQFNPTKLFLEKDALYKTHGGELRVHNRLKTGQLIKRKPLMTFGSQKKDDIISFTKKSNEIFTGRRNGEINVYFTDSDCFEIQCNALNDRIESVDFHDGIYISTTLNETVIWKKEFELGIPCLDLIKKIPSGNKSIRISPDGERCATGKYSERPGTALRLVNIETSQEVILNSATYSIYDILWKNNQTIMTANYDTTFRLFDCRTNRDEFIWTDPYDLSVYCIQYDGNYGVLSGMRYHCRVNLYDLRVPKKYIQLYFPTMKFRGASGSSPAYSVVNDQSQMFIATDHNLRIFNFDADWAESKDYTNIFVHEIIAYA